MRAILLSATSALAVLVAGTAIAQTPPERGMRADADGDGRISRAEFIDGRLARLTAVDANRDGSVSAEELRSGRETRMNQRRSARFERLDQDANGAIDRQEFTAGGARAEDGPRAGRHGAHRRALRAERRAERRVERGANRGPVQIAEVRNRMEQTFDRLDADRDGFVTVEERRAHHQARRAGGRPSPSTGTSD